MVSLKIKSSSKKKETLVKCIDTRVRVWYNYWSLTHGVYYGITGTNPKCSQNFSDINPNILINEGNTIKTISEPKNVLASATVDNKFTQKFGIYDLKEFIGVLSLVDQPNLNFADESVTVSDQSGRSKVRYFFSPEETLTSPQKDINMPECEVQFDLDANTLTKLRNAASTLGHNEVSVTPG